MNKYELIFNRTQVDIDLIRELRKNNLPIPISELKSFADWRMWKRIEDFTEAIADKIESYGYILDITIRKWNVNDLIYTISDSKRIFGNINKLRDQLRMPDTTPQTPTTIHNITWQTANDIEKILFDIWTLVFDGPATLISSDKFMLISSDKFILTAMIT